MAIVFIVVYFKTKNEVTMNCLIFPNSRQKSQMQWDNMIPSWTIKLTLQVLHCSLIYGPFLILAYGWMCSLKCCRNFATSLQKVQRFSFLLKSHIYVFHISYASTCYVTPTLNRNLFGCLEAKHPPLKKVRDGGTLSIPDRCKFLNVWAVYENTNHHGEPG